MQKYNLIACGGTFDFFHKGHKSFLQFALKQADRLIVGITSDQYIQSSKFKAPYYAKASRGKQNSKLIEPYEKRKMHVEDFLRGEKCLDRIEILPIDDVFGPTILPQYPIEALSVSDKTKIGAEIVNSKREELGMEKLPTLVCHLEKAEDGEEISSSRIRLGEIDREGILYVRPEFFSGPLFLPEEVRRELKKPLGDLVTNYKTLLPELDPAKTITVGDVVTKLGNDMLFRQAVSVVDFVVQREKKYAAITDLGFLGTEKILSVENPAGFVTPKLFEAVQAVFRQLQTNTRFVICVTGEEDLAVLPVILAAPLGFVVLYGQPYSGMVKIVVTEEVKNKARDIVFRFTS